VTHPHVIGNLYEFLSQDTKEDIFEESALDYYIDLTISVCLFFRRK